MSYKVGDWIMATLWRMGIEKKSETIKTIVLDINDDGNLLVAWNHGTSGGGGDWWITGKHQDIPTSINENSHFGQALGKICPNIVSKCLRKRFSHVGI